MAFAKLTWRESLSKLYPMGFRYNVHSSILAEAHESRDWRIFSDFAAVLILLARKLYLDEGLGFDLMNMAYAPDATTVDL